MWKHVAGLAYSFDISYVVGFVLLVLMLRRRVPRGLGLRALAAPLVRITAMSGVMGVCVFVVLRAVHAADIVRLLAAVGAGAILYLAFSQVAGVDERMIVLGLFHGRK